MPTFSHTTQFRNLLSRRLGALIGGRKVIRISQLKAHRIHHQIFTRAVERGLITKIDRGLYLIGAFHNELEHRIAIACARVPHGIVCLESALQFHALVPSQSAAIWMAIDRKARKPKVKGLRLRFVRFSWKALTQGVVNSRIDGVPVRIHSSAKSIADCLKYRNKIGFAVAVHAFRQSTRLNKCSRERLLHFAKICHVEEIARCLYRTGSTADYIARQFSSLKVEEWFSPQFSPK